MSDKPEEYVVGNRLTEQERELLDMKARISRMTNADLFDAFEGWIPQVKVEKKANLVYIEMAEELERRLQRIGFLPPVERLAELRRARK